MSDPRGREVTVRSRGGSGSGSGSGRVFRVDDAGVRAVALMVEGRRLPVEDRGPWLVVDGRSIEAEDLTLAAEPEVGASGEWLAWHLEGAGVVLDVRVEADAWAPVVRTHLEVSGTGRLQRVTVERWGPGLVLRGPPDALDPRHLGQPLWGDGFFAALEHPGAENVALAAGASFGLPVDVDLDGEGPFVSPVVVVGGSAPGQELSAFWDELDRSRGQPAHLLVLANNWYQLGAVGRMEERSVRAELEGFGAVAEAHGVALDHYCLDDPWDGEWAPATGIWGRLAPSRFPGGLAALQQAAADGATGGIGLWVSPWGGYYDRHDQRVAWARGVGYEVEDGSWPRLCPAGDRYRDHLTSAFCQFTAAGVRYWKLDGVQFDCQSPDHGHPVGPGGRTAQMDRFAEFLDAVRAVDPGVVLAFTTGSNPSPFWLRHADFLWRGGLDDAAPEEFDGGHHDRFATYIDSCLDALRGTALPVSAIVTFSLVENQVRAYRDEDEDPQIWERHCWLLAARGTHHHDLYVAPDSLSDWEWEALARVLAWARRRQRVLARSRMVGGRPQAGEPYGFVSTAGDEVVVCLRNPRDRSQAFHLTAADVGGSVDGLEPVWGRALVPTIGAGAGTTVDLEPFEVVVASGRWEPSRG